MTCGNKKVWAAYDVRLAHGHGPVLGFRLSHPGTQVDITRTRCQACLTQAGPGSVTPSHHMWWFGPGRGSALAAAKPPAKVKVKVKTNPRQSRKRLHLGPEELWPLEPSITPDTQARQTSHGPAHARTTRVPCQADGPARCLRTRQALGASPNEEGPGHGF